MLSNGSSLGSILFFIGKYFCSIYMTFLTMKSISPFPFYILPTFTGSLTQVITPLRCPSHWLSSLLNLHDFVLSLDSGLRQKASSNRISIRLFFSSLDYVVEVKSDRSFGFINLWKCLLLAIHVMIRICMVCSDTDIYRWKIYIAPIVFFFFFFGWILVPPHAHPKGSVQFMIFYKSEYFKPHFEGVLS